MNYSIIRELRELTRIITFLSRAGGFLGGGIAREFASIRARMTKIWSAVAERSGDTAFRERASFPKRRGASLPAALQILLLRRQQRLAYLCPTVVVLNCDELGYNT